MRAMVVLSYPYRPINSTVACRMRRRVTSPRALRRLEFIETFLRAKALLDNTAGPPTDIPQSSIHRSSNDEKSRALPDLGTITTVNCTKHYGNRPYGSRAAVDQLNGEQHTQSGVG